MPRTPSRPANRLPDLPYRRLAGLAITGIGALIVVFLVYLFAFTPLTAARDQQRLTQTLVGQPLTVYSLVRAGHRQKGRRSRSWRSR